MNIYNIFAFLNPMLNTYIGFPVTTPSFLLLKLVEILFEFAEKNRVFEPRANLPKCGQRF